MLLKAKIEIDLKNLSENIHSERKNRIKELRREGIEIMMVQNGFAGENYQETYSVNGYTLITAYNNHTKKAEAIICGEIKGNDLMITNYAPYIIKGNYLNLNDKLEFSLWQPD